MLITGNNSASYFRLCNTDLHHHNIKKSIKKRPIVVLRMGSTSELVIKDPLELYLVSLTLETIIKGNLLSIMGVEKENVGRMYSKTNEEIKRIIKVNE